MTERNEPGEEGARRPRRREPERESGDNPLKQARILQRRWRGAPAHRGALRAGTAAMAGAPGRRGVAGDRPDHRAR